ncbi:MAG: efflux RND transporter permease subunit [Firmicutes bacterium]|nr:efflux RND transporter permease subunit [Bacillota bacterium]
MFSKFSVRKPLTILVAVVIVMVFGAISVYKMTPDLFPSVDTPYVIVMTTYPGASPEEAETEITKPMEQGLATIANLEGINSVSGNNYSMIQMEFTDGVSMDVVSVDISQRLDQIEGLLPETASTPVVLKMSMDVFPSVIAAVEMGDKTEAEISKIVEDDLMTPLEGIEGVANVSALGLVDSDIQIVLSQDKIDKVNDRVQSKIKSEFNSAKGKVNKGIKQANSGKKKIEQGKDKITEGEKEAAKQFSKARKELKNNQEDLKDLKKGLQDMQSEYEAAKMAAESNPLMAANLETLKQMINGQLEAINKQMGTDYTADTLGDAIKDVNSNIKKINSALEDITKEEQTTSFQLNSQYSELTTAEGTIESTVSQLKNTLKEIENQKDAALNSADMTGVLTMNNVSAILSAQNFSMPAGYVNEGDSQILVSVGDKIRDKDELQNLILMDPNIDGIDPIRLSDIATVTYGSDDNEAYAKVNGKNGVCLTFTKQSTYATAVVADNILDKFESLEKKYDGLHFVSLYNGGDYIHLVINSVLENLLLGALLAMLILFFFLRDIRPTVITAISIPLSVLFALVLMYFSGVTLNMVSMAGLAIGVGMLVDNSIVVIENIFRLRTMGYSKIQSAVSGAVQVAGAITASTLTTISVFVPIIFVTGMTRDIFQDLALTVSYSLLASLIIALTLVPAMAKGMLKGDGSKAMLKQDGFAVRQYKRAANWALGHKAITLSLAFLILIGSCGLALSKGFEFMPSMSTPQISARISMPEESTIDDTSRACDDISEEIRKIDGVDEVGLMLSSNTQGLLGIYAGTDVTQVSMYIMMDEKKLDNVAKVTSKIDELAEKHGCEIVTSADMDMSSMMGGSDISMTLYNDDLDDLRESAAAIEAHLRDMKGLEDISDVDSDSSEELHIVVSKNKAMKKGLTVAQVYQQVSEKLAEEKTATTISDEEDNIDVVIENTTKDSFTKTDLRNMKLTFTDQAGGETKKVKLSDVAVINPDKSLSEINHTDQKRSLTITATLKDGYNITKMTDKVKKDIESNQLIQGTTEIDYGGQNEEIMDAMKQMMLMLIVGFLLIYLVMVAQFQSLRSPFIIIFTVPLAFTGGMLGLLITGQTVSVVSMMGFVMLMGIIVNNGIVLVDTINRFRLEGMEMKQAIIDAGAVRMRPVIMTALTTVLGLVPLAIGFGTGAEMMRPIAIVCIGGLIYATVTTLIVVPVMYRLFSRKRMEKIAEEELEIVNV